MSEFVKPDQIFRVPIKDGWLHISPSYDFLHHFPNDAWMLRYWNTDVEPPKLCNIFLHQDAAKFLMNACEVEMIDRRYMGTEEHEQYLGWAATSLLTELDFEVSDGEN